MRIWQAGKKREAAVIPPYTEDEHLWEMAKAYAKHGKKLLKQWEKLDGQNTRRRKRLARMRPRQ